MRNIGVAILLCLGVASVSQASTQIAGISNSNSQIKDCSAFTEFQSEPVGSECFVRFENGIIRGHFKISEYVTKNGQTNKGLEVVGTGLIFENTIARNLSYRAAAQLCWKKGLKLPTGYPKYRNGEWDYPNRDSDFALAENHGLREAFGTKMKYRFFWSSSGVDPDRVNSFVYSGNDGDLYYFYNGHAWWHYSTAAICVSGSHN
ncbi:MAG: hypothetical protein AAGB31_11015 [Bdellovibrio sp.]